MLKRLLGMASTKIKEDGADAINNVINTTINGLFLKVVVILSLVIALGLVIIGGFWYLVSLF